MTTGWVRAAAGGGMYPCAFLDRDGVINKDVKYVHHRDRFHFCRGVFAACRWLRAAGYRLVVVTNQGGIALDYYQERDFHDLTTYMVGEFARRGVVLDGVYYSPYHPNTREKLAAWKRWRKPDIGMVAVAAVAHRIDLSRSLLVGDKPTDMECAKAAGIPQRFYVDEDLDREVNDTATFADRKTLDENKTPDENKALDGCIPCRSLAHAVAFLRLQRRRERGGGVK